MRRLHLTIPGIPPPLNKYRRMSRYDQTKDKHQWQLVSANRAGEAMRKTRWKAPPFAHITAVFWFKQERRRDPEGFTVSLKGPLDGLVDAGAIIDDDFDHISLQVLRGGVDKRNPRIEITVEAVEEDSA